jgi:NitT/TauT family transport system ATP-binding protein
MSPSRGGGRMLRIEEPPTIRAVETLPTPVLAAHDLAIWYGTSSPVLAAFSLTVGQGEFVSIIGPSGSGKSTALNALAGILPPSAHVSGTIDHPDGGALGYLFQRETLLPWRRVIDNVAVPLELRGAPKRERQERARAMIARYGLEGFERHYPSQLSGGMRQRVLLMRTLIYEPAVVFLDEPLGSLDAQTRLSLQEELRRMRGATGGTFVLVTHHLDEAIALGTRIVVLGGKPARVRAEYAVDLPTGESIMELRGHPAFRDLARQLWEDLRTEGGP